jgi:hypothetical protein
MRKYLIIISLRLARLRYQFIDGVTSWLMKRTGKLHNNIVQFRRDAGYDELPLVTNVDKVVIPRYHRGANKRYYR